MNFAGVDIGGANLKFANSTGVHRQIEFPIWQSPDRLQSVLQELAPLMAAPTCLGVTLTAELADCFDSKRQGVEFIVDSVESVFAEQAPLYYQTNGEMCDAIVARENWSMVAASNWHALAWFAFLDSPQRSGFMFDIGSTTTDIIPVREGSPVGVGQTDFDRLANKQLFYAGMERTPVCSLLPEVRFADSTVTIAREWFATMLDVFLWLNQGDPSSSTQTADGRPSTRFHAGQRLSRMVCSDRDELSLGQIDAIAIQAKDRLMMYLADCVQPVVNQFSDLPLYFRTFGGGAWLAEALISQLFPGTDSRPGAQWNGARVVAHSYLKEVNQTAAAQAVAKKRELVFAQSKNN